MQDMVFPVIAELEARLPYFCVGVGCFYEQEDIRRPDGYPYYQWIQCRKGRGELFLGGTRYVVGEGQGMLLFPGEPHFYNSIDGSWQVDWVIFCGSGIEGFLLETAGIRESSVLNVEQPLRLSEKIVRLYGTACLSSPIGNISCSVQVYEILADIMSLAAKKQMLSMDGKYRRFEGVISYINENYSKTVSLDDLAAIAGVSPQYLCGAFKKLTSHTVFEYINLKRIQKSKELLVGGLKVKEAAAAAGFNDESYFCMMFRRCEGMSPLDFRRLHRGEK